MEEKKPMRAANKCDTLSKKARVFLNEIKKQEGLMSDGTA